jgi:ribosomal protein S18 acetylase RimI-like enzyme
MEIRYRDSADSILSENLVGFFVGWNNPPTSETHLELLQKSSHCVVALDGEAVIGFITAISDGVLAAYIPFLEVLPAYQQKGIGKELVTRMIALLNNYYMIDLLCDPELQVFYEQFGMEKATGMMLRNYSSQKGI